MANPGPETTLTDDLSLKIQSLCLEGKKYAEIQRELDIPAGTWDYWVNKNIKEFKDNLRRWKNQVFLRKAEKVSDEIFEIPHEKEDGIDKDMLKIKQKESEFIRSTIGKDEGYSSKSDDALKTIADNVQINDEQLDRIIRARAAKLNSKDLGAGGTD